MQRITMMQRHTSFKPISSCDFVGKAHTLSQRPNQRFSSRVSSRPMTEDPTRSFRAPMKYYLGPTEIFGPLSNRDVSEGRYSSHLSW